MVVAAREYLYVDLGRYTALVPDLHEMEPDEPPNISASFKNTLHLGRVALTYRF